MPDRPNELAARTEAFALDVRKFVNALPRLISNYDDARQLARSSGSVAANYLEAQEGCSRKDFFYRIKLCRKEARERELWLRLVQINTRDLVAYQSRLLQEAGELRRIFSAIAQKDDTQEG